MVSVVGLFPVVKFSMVDCNNIFSISQIWSKKLMKFNIEV